MNNNDNLNRKEAIKKLGKYAAITAMGSFLILNPKRAQATSDFFAPRSSANSDTTDPSTLIDD